MKEAYLTTIRDLKIAQRNQTLVELILSLFGIGIDYDAEIAKYKKLLKEEESKCNCKKIK